MKEFDKIFHDRLRPYGSEVPPSVWEGIERKRRKRRGLLWWWLGGMGLMVALAGASALWFWPAKSTLQNGTASTQSEVTMDVLAQPKNAVDVTAMSEFSEGKKTKPAAEDVFQPNLPKAKMEVKSAIFIPQKQTAKTTEQTAETTDIQLIEQTEDTPSIEFFTEKTTSAIGLKMLPIRWSPVIWSGQPDLPNTIVGEPSDEGDGADKPKTTHFYLDLLGGASIHRQLLGAKSKDDKAYKNLRDDTERERLSYTATLRLSVVKPSGLALRTGLTYTLINDRFHWNQAPVTRLEVQGDTILGSRTGRWIKTTWNRYHFVEVPLLLGYEGQVGKLEMSFSAGPMVNVWFRQRGDFMSPGKRTVSFTEGERGSYPAFRNWAGVSLFASSSLNYQLNPNVQVLLEPYLRYQLTNLTIDRYPLTQRTLTGGVMLGLRRNF